MTWDTVSVIDCCTDITDATARVFFWYTAESASYLAASYRGFTQDN